MNEEHLMMEEELNALEDALGNEDLSPADRAEYEERMDQLQGRLYGN